MGPIIIIQTNYSVGKLRCLLRLCYYLAPAIFSSVCASQSQQDNHRVFKIEFGYIIEVGEYYQIEEVEKTIEKFQRRTPKFGVRIEYLARKPYELGYIIYKRDSPSKRFKEFSRGGYWSIKPPVNEDYEAFLFENKKEYFPGEYQFVVIVDEKMVKIIDFVVAEY